MQMLQLHVVSNSPSVGLYIPVSSPVLLKLWIGEPAEPAVNTVILLDEAVVIYGEVNDK